MNFKSKPNMKKIKLSFKKIKILLYIFLFSDKQDINLPYVYKLNN